MIASLSLESFITIYSRFLESSKEKESVPEKLNPAKLSVFKLSHPLNIFSYLVMVPTVISAKSDKSIDFIELQL